MHAQETDTQTPDEAQATPLFVFADDAEFADKPRTPELRAFFVIDKLPQYEFDDQSVMKAFMDMIRSGVSAVIVRRVVVDKNYPVAATPQVIETATNGDKLPEF